MLSGPNKRRMVQSPAVAARGDWSICTPPINELLARLEGNTESVARGSMLLNIMEIDRYETPSIHGASTVQPYVVRQCQTISN